MKWSKQRIDARNTWTRSDFCTDEWVNNYIPNYMKILKSKQIYRKTNKVKIKMTVVIILTINSLVLSGKLCKQKNNGVLKPHYFFV
jgi:hypothetical protein